MQDKDRYMNQESLVTGIVVHPGMFAGEFTIQIEFHPGDTRYVIVSEDTKLLVNGKESGLKEIIEFVRNSYEVTIKYVQDIQRYSHTVSVDFFESACRPNH